MKCAINRNLLPNTVPHFQWLLILAVAMTPGFCVGSIYHVRYEDAISDTSAIEALYQALMDDVNVSLGYSVVERFDHANETLTGYREFVLQLSAFRWDLRRRNVDAKILDDGYSTAPLSTLGLSSQNIIQSQMSLYEMIGSAMDASMKGEKARVWARLAMAKSYVREFNASIYELKLVVDSVLPAFIDGGPLRSRIAELEGKLSGYVMAILALEPHGVPPTLTLNIDRETAYKGEKFLAWGTFRADSNLLPEIDVSIFNTSGVLSAARTDSTGSYRCTILVPTNASSGKWSLRAMALLEQVEVWSREVELVVLDPIQVPNATPGGKIPTFLTLDADPDTARPRTNITLSGYLQDYKGRGIANQQIVILTRDGERYEAYTNYTGTYIHILTTPSIQQTLSLKAHFEGSQVYGASETPWIHIEIIDQPAPANIFPKLSSNTTIVLPGQPIKFEGELTYWDASPLSNETLGLFFLGEQTQLKTDQEGRYDVTVVVPIGTPPGTYPAQTTYQPPPDTNLTPAKSNMVYILVETDNRSLVPTFIELVADSSQITAGDVIGFWGLLSTSDGAGIPNAKIRISFLGTDLMLTTEKNGSFKTDWKTDLLTSPGRYGARAYFDPIAGSGLSPSRSNLIHVIILARHRIPTTLEISASKSSGMTGEEISITGRLFDVWGRGLVGRTIWLQSPNLSSETSLHTHEDGRYQVELDLPSVQGLFLVRSTFSGDAEYAPCISPFLSISVLSTIPGPQATQIIMTAPDRIKAGDRIPIFGRLTNENGDGLGSKEIIIEWDGQPFWTVTTVSDGRFHIEPRISKDFVGTHILRAIFNSDDPAYLSSSSAKSIIEVWSYEEGWITLTVIMITISVIAIGLAIARGSRPRIVPQTVLTKVPDRFSNDRMGTEVRPTPRRGKVEEAEMVIPSSGDRKRSIVDAYVALVELISEAFQIDLRYKTHTEICSMLASKRIPQEANEASEGLTEIYERTAFSPVEPTADEEMEFARDVENLVSALKHEGVG